MRKFCGLVRKNLDVTMPNDSKKSSRETVCEPWFSAYEQILFVQKYTYTLEYMMFQARKHWNQRA